jgi:hypothetical protein
MHSCKTQLSLRVVPLILAALLLNVPKAHAENNDPMTLAIAGSILSFGLACYQGKAPCSLSPGIDTEQQTLSLDRGEDGTLKHWRLAWGAEWREKFYESRRFEIGGRWELNAQQLSSTRAGHRSDDDYIIGLTPLFQYRYKLNGYHLYMETGAGLLWLNDPYIENEFKSTQIQFGDIFGLGIQSQRFELGYRYLHISNAGIELPNPGTDLHNIHLGYRF